MRRRVFTTTKVLSVAFAILPTGCTKTDVHPEPTPTALPAQSTPPVASAPAASPSVPDWTKVDPKLIDLAGELGNTDRDKALANLDHYRPLCDAKGYPLVGNLPSKGMEPKKVLTVAEVCAAVRPKTN